MNNIFKNAYFGKAYKTRNGRKAIYLGEISRDISDNPNRLALSEIYDVYVMDNGRASSLNECEDDIISEWADEDEPNTTNKYKLMWEELWNVIVPPNSSICEQDGSKIMHSATNILHKYFPPLNPM